MRKYLFLLVAFACAGCAQAPELVLMQNPKTQEIVQCRHDPWANFTREDVRNCVDGYTKAGWINLNQPPAQN